MQSTIVEHKQTGFQDLAVQVRDAGLLERRTGYYIAKISLTVLAFGAGWAGLVALGDTWASLGIAVYLGVVFTQLGFVSHDAGHHQILRSRRANRALGLAVGDGLMGVSFGWWVPKHSAHHAHPNQVGLDPDVGSGPPGSPDATGKADGAPSRFRANLRAALFIPLMLLRSTGLHIYGIQRLVRNRNRSALLEGALISLHVAVYLAIVLWTLSPFKALAFVVVQQAVFSMYLGCSFAPNHKGMPIIEGDAPMSFASRQVVTSRNVRGGRFTAFVLGGLNYQIEHHLFPAMPRPNLARAQPLIRAFCLDSGLDYCEEGVVGSFRQILRYQRDGSTQPVGSA